MGWPGLGSRNLDAGLDGQWYQKSDDRSSTMVSFHSNTLAETGQKENDRYSAKYIIPDSSLFRIDELSQSVG